MRQRIPFHLWSIALVSTVASLTSLYWSFVLHWIPCDLCWYERICMYPTAVISLIACASRDVRGYFKYIFPLCVIGVFVSLYHYLLQMVPALNNSTGCTSIVSCAIPDFTFFGFITPPLCAFTAFLFIALVAAYGAMKARRNARAAA